MDTKAPSQRPMEDQELEDGEICDDEAEERAPPRRRERGRPGRGAPPRDHKLHPHPHSLPHHLHPPPDFCLLLPYNLGPHGPFPSNHRPQCGPSGPDRPLAAAPPAAAPPLPPLGPHGEASPRSGFWERSHCALGRFRHRGMPNGGRGGWGRGGREGGGWGPPGRYGPGESHSSPARKPMQSTRNKSKKVVRVVPRTETIVDESFEDLLSKYKQIQLELECIRKEETMALTPAVAATENLLDAAPPEDPPRPEPEVEEPEKAEKKVFQAFNIKPLRQKIPKPPNLDQFQKKWAEEDEEGEADVEGCVSVGDQQITEESEEKKMCECCGQRISADGAEPATDSEKTDGSSSDQKPQQTCCCLTVLVPGADPPVGRRVTTRSASLAAAAASASEKAETGPKPSPKSGSGPGKANTIKKTISPGDLPTTETEATELDDKPCVCCTEATEKPMCVCSRESSTSSEDSPASADKQVVKVEEEELSELQLRLLALQSASKKWQQKELQVMKKSKDRITKATQERTTGPGAPSPSRQRVTTRSASSAAAAERSRTRSKPVERDRAKSGTRPPDRDRDRLSVRDRPKAVTKTPPERSRPPGKPHVTKKTTTLGSTVKQAFRKQQVRTWKLQQQREQEEKRRQEEEERRKREEEIRRIRDLSNQDEQYNRFMKLVGGHKNTRSKSRDRELRRSIGKPGLDVSGNLYQYDNYEEVAMDTDSEAGSPMPSPTHYLTSTDQPGRGPPFYTSEPAFGVDFSQPFFSPMLPGVPPPPPPLPPPLDEPEPPPKPPYADEEEEEEMLLRETCLMSMANKRVTPTEMGSSGPPSPSCPLADVQQPTRGNLSTVSLNTVSQSQRNKFPRGHHAGRAPLVLPRHKSVVVSLNDSEDSDSDVDACSSSQTVFGGLEFMIKEARRTVEAAKPKVASGSEKENNPVRTIEVLPEIKKIETRQLREEISREKLKTPREPILSSSMPQDFSLKPAEQKLSEAAQRLSKHRELLQRDEAILRQLLQQELKKSESLKAAETKVSKLREQLQANEKIVLANRTLLRKLQEQVRRVEQRVSLKKSAALLLEREVLQAQKTAGRGSKRKLESNQPGSGKLQRLSSPSRGSERHFAELIAHKQRLQQLESEYALKIQKLKEAQALRNKGPAPEPPAEATSRSSDAPDPQVLPALPPSPSFPLPQPSLHDLTQDKLTLDSEDVPEADVPEADVSEADDHNAELTPAAATRGKRRSSLRQSNASFTKPNLDTPSSAPKDSGSKVVKVASSCGVPAKALEGLDLDTLKKSYMQEVRLGELLRTELHKLGEGVEVPAAGQEAPEELEVVTSQSSVSELKPVPFEPYHSPLLVFKSYRFSTYYRTKEKLPLSSVTYSNAIDPNKNFCRFDLTGTCNHDGCRWQHMRNVTLTGNQLFEDILSYSLPLIGCLDSDSDNDISLATEKYIKKLFGTNKDRMGVAQKAVLLVSKVNESRRHVPPFTTCKDMRRWRPKTQCSVCPEEDSDDEDSPRLSGGAGEECLSLLSMDVCVSSEDRRYFISETDDISNLESSVVESPHDTQLWIKLAYKYLGQGHMCPSESLEAALNTLSRALESNCEDPEVWSHYLTLFSRRGSKEEVQEMCEMAVEHAADYRVWWKYLTLENAFEGKDFVCERLLHFLLAEASSGVSEKTSFQLMEALLYRVQLSVFTGRFENAVAILQTSLKSSSDRTLADMLTASDRALLWLCYIHLLEFQRLPVSLYDPAKSGPDRLVSHSSFLLPWKTSEDICTPPDTLLALFTDAVQQCSEDTASLSQRTLACLPLHTNLILLYRLLHKYDDGVSLCESLLQMCPELCAVRDSLAELHVLKGESERGVSLWMHALAECPHNAEVFYHCCSFLMGQDKCGAVAPLFRGFILSLCEDEQSQRTPVDILRHHLGLSSEELRATIIKKELQEQLSQQMSYLHLIHCRWQWLHGSVENAVEAFERALGSNLQLEDLHRLWMDYLQYSCSSQTSHTAPSTTFSDLLHRCLSTVPTRLEVPFNPADFWTCYNFHNKVVSLYLSRLPQSHHSLLLEKLHCAMPYNTELGLRLLYLHWQNGLMEQLKFQARMMSCNTPKCLAVWKILIAVQMELKELVEVQVVYQQALKHLPLCADLWKHRLLLEMTVAGASERVRPLLDACVKAGVSMSLGQGVGGVAPSGQVM